MMNYYPPQILANAETGLPLVGLKDVAGTVIARGNPASSPEIYEDKAATAIIPAAGLTVTENMFVRGFYVDDAFGRISFWGGGIEVPLTSEEGNAARIEELADGTTAAAAAAESASQSADAAAADAQAARIAAENVAAGGAVTGIAGAPASWPPVFPAKLGATSGDAAPGDDVYRKAQTYTKSEVAELIAGLEVGDGGGEVTLDTLPSTVRRQNTTTGLYEPRGTARTDLPITWQGATPPPYALPSSGVDFVTTATAMLGADYYQVPPAEGV